MKKVFFLIYVCIIASILSCTDDKDNKGLPYNYLDTDANTIVKIAQPNQLKTDLKANGLLKETSDPILALISTSEILSNWKTQSPFYFSLKGEGETASIVFAKAIDTLSFTADSTPNATVKNVSVNNVLLQKIVLNNDSLFMTIKDSVSIFSNSKQSLLSILEQKEYALDNDLNKLLLLPQEGDLVQTGMTSLFPNNISEGKTVHTSQAIQILPDGIQVSGIVKSKDSSVIDVFKGQVPQATQVTTILPSDFKSANGFTFSDPELLITHLKKHQQDSTEITVHPLLETLTEITEAKLKDGKALFLSSIDIPQSLSSIELDIKEVETFRDITIFENNLSSLLSSSFYPLLSSGDYPYLVILDSYMVCASSLAGAKSVVSAFQNKKTLDKTPYYPLINEQMLSSSLYSLSQGIAVAAITNSILNTQIPVNTNSNYPLAILQYSYDNTFAHLNFVTKEISKAKQVSGTVNQKFSVSLPQPIIGSPQFFTNHRTRGQDVLVQDINNTLYSYSSTGKKLWSKKLDSAILGEIKEVDLLRNGKKQLAFATQNTFYILDRNGDDVAPFPKKFKDKITQALAVFDYDNNRKYRFVITQGNAIFMYNSKGKIVKGFTFKKTKTPLVFAPKHFRLGNKDFIVLAEKNGKTSFLSRTGKERVKVNKTFKFGEIPIQKEGLHFVIISEDNKKHTITSSGETSTQNITTSESYSFKTLGKTKVTLDDNLLRINGVLIELPFGIYSKPQIVHHRNNTYISVTDMQEHKVYIYDNNRKLLEGFPVYGTTQARLVSSGKKLLLVTTGSDAEVLCYQVN